jgi:hypothetical protein
MSDDVRVEVPDPAGAKAAADMPRLIALNLVASRLTLIGVLVSVGLGVAGVVLSAGVDWRLALDASVVSVAASVALLRYRWTQDRLARFAEWVLPGNK